MFKRLFSFNNPLGLAFTATALLLALSPEARKGTRKALVRGAAALLSVGDQMKGLTAGARKQLGTIMNEAKVEKEQMALPDFGEMVKNAGSKTKSTMNNVLNDMKMNIGNPAPSNSVSVEMSQEFAVNPFEDFQDAIIKTKQKKPSVNKGQTKNNVHNVLSNQAYQSITGNPPKKS
ncbi:hypothetical protein [Peribacillus kribbensis]|uniref:hypothetical protein n=1 Tax=Peribacillus kribbensis TaxID=356658 RepID=UPI00041F11B2|nr:hypothetical protein [Peribacillus kribbensis]